MSQLTILGAGSYGTALAMVLGPRYERVVLWSFERELAEQMEAHRENRKYLEGFRLPPNVRVVSRLADALEAAEVVLVAVPSMHVRSVFAHALAYLPPEAPIVSATKGVERGTSLRMSEVIAAVTRPKFPARIAVLSGPSFAKELARGEPTLVAASAVDGALAARVQREFTGPTFRIYTNTDPVGTELGGALKNVIAIAAGVSSGLGLGSNAMAALLTRGLAELTRLAVSLGAQASTLSGLAGLGDLILTCTGDLSRNRRVGLELARGRTLAEIQEGMHMVAEGVENTYSAVELARRQRISMPIAETMHAIFEQSKSPHDALRELMEREPGAE